MTAKSQSAENIDVFPSKIIHEVRTKVRKTNVPDIQLLDEYKKPEVGFKCKVINSCDIISSLNKFKSYKSSDIYDISFLVRHVIQSIAQPLSIRL